MAGRASAGPRAGLGQLRRSNDPRPSGHGLATRLGLALVRSRPPPRRRPRPGPPPPAPRAARCSRRPPTAPPPPEPSRGAAALRGARRASARLDLRPPRPALPREPRLRPRRRRAVERSPPGRVGLRGGRRHGEPWHPRATAGRPRAPPPASSRADSPPRPPRVSSARRSSTGGSTALRCLGLGDAFLAQRLERGRFGGGGLELREDRRDRRLCRRRYAALDLTEHGPPRRGGQALQGGGEHGRTGRSDRRSGAARSGPRPARLPPASRVLLPGSGGRSAAVA